jgi:hypothetical protein
MTDELTFASPEQISADPEPPMTHGELYELVEALEKDLEGFSKTALVLYLAVRTVDRAWYLNGKRRAITEAREQLLAGLKRWVPEARNTNRHNRFVATMERLKTGKLTKAERKAVRRGSKS